MKGSGGVGGEGRVLALVSLISIKVKMMNDFIMSEPHRAYGF